LEGIGKGRKESYGDADRENKIPELDARLNWNEVLQNGKGK